MDDIKIIFKYTEGYHFKKDCNKYYPPFNYDTLVLDKYDYCYFLQIGITDNYKLYINYIKNGKITKRKYYSIGYINNNDEDNEKYLQLIPKKHYISAKQLINHYKDNLLIINKILNNC